jgi:hypothetical protein
LSEAFFLLRETNGGTERLVELLERGVVLSTFTLNEEIPEIGKLLRKYGNVPMSLADACLVRMAEMIPRAVVLTLDSDFRFYRKNRRFEIPLLSPN